MNTKPYYYLATVDNGTSISVRIEISEVNPYNAFVKAARQLTKYNFIITSMQRLNKEQFDAPNNAPLYNKTFARVTEIIQ